MKKCLAANALFSSLVLVLCLFTTLGIPLRHVSWWILASFVFLIVFGSIKYVKLRLRFKPAVAVTAATIAIVAVVGLKSFQDCFPSITPDTWAYASFGQYLTDYSRGDHGALPLIDQFSATLSGTRFGTPSLLGFLSVVFHFDTARALLPVVLIVLANGFFGFYLITRLLGTSEIIALGSGIFFVLCGWTSDALIIGNLDNLLFLSLSSVFLARLLLLVRGCRSRQALAALTINLAAIFYSYPEGFVLTAVIIVPFVFEVGFRAWKVGGKLWQGLVAVTVATTALIAPYLPTWITFLSQQWSVEHSLGRAGEGIFPGLLSPAFMPALLGLGQEFSRTVATLPSLILAGGAAVLCAAGVLSLKSWRIAKASAFFIAIGLGVLQGACLKYDYGLYKIVILSSLVWLPAMFLGIHRIVRNFRQHNRFLASVASCLLLQSSFLFVRFENQGSIPYQTKIEIRLYEQIQGLSRVIRDRPVVLECNSDFEYEWGLFYARRLHTQILKYKSYLKLFYDRDLFGARHLLPSLGGEQVPAYILSDYPFQKTIWSNGVFYLTELDSGPSIVSIDSPNGIESVRGKRFLWIGNQPIKFFIFSDRERTVVLNSEAVALGPSLPRSQSRKLCVRSANVVQDLEVSDRFAVSLQLGRGINEVEVWCSDKPEILKQPNGDTRILLLGLLNYQVAVRNVPIRISGPESSMKVSDRHRCHRRGSA